MQCINIYTFFMESTETAEAKTTTMEEKVVDAEKKLSKVDRHAAEAEEEFREQKKCANGLSKNIVHLAIKLGGAGNHLASIHQKVKAACRERPKQF